MGDDYATELIKSAGDGDFAAGVEALVKAARDAGYLTPEQDEWLREHPGQLLPHRGDLTEVEHQPARKVAGFYADSGAGWVTQDLTGLTDEQRPRQRTMRGTN